MQFSMSIDYAVHGLVYLAFVSPGKTTLLSEIAKAIKVTESYLRKVFQLLAKRRIVLSQRGAKGGYLLARKPDQITLKDIIDAIDGSPPIYSCLKIQRKCNVTQNCVLKETFEKATARMLAILEETSLKDLAADLSNHAGELGWLKATI
jgi:Rrf2 family protein